MKQNTTLGSLSDHQLRVIFKTLSGLDFSNTREFEDLASILGEITQAGRANWPFDSPDQVFLIPERFPIFTDILVLRRSHLVNRLFDQGEGWVALIVDSILTGKDALFFARTFANSTDMTEWFGQLALGCEELFIKPLDDGLCLLLSPVKSFIVP